ncbi:MAG: S8 family serine peptidase [Bacteroidota bacterium]
MKKNLLSLALAWLFALSFSRAQDWTSQLQSLYYFNGTEKVYLTPDPSSFAIYFKDQVPEAQAMRNMSDLKFQVAYPRLQMAKFSAKSVSRSYATAESNKLLTTSGLSSSGATEMAPSFRIDGQQVWLTKQVVLKLSVSPSDTRVQSLLKTYNATLLKHGSSTLLQLETVARQLPFLQAMYDAKLIAWGQPNFQVAVKKHNDPLFPEQFQMNNTGGSLNGQPLTNDVDIDALEAWGITKGTNSITVAVIDDGLENHPDLPPISAGFSPANNGDGTPNSEGEHGVACAGIVAGLHDNGIGVRGVAPNVTLIGVNIFIGSETIQDLADSFEWAKNQGADVISNSWGFANNCSSNPFPALTSAIVDAANNGRNGRGCVILFASGNEFNDCISYPSSISSVIAVGAVSPDGDISAYSNQGPKLDIVAPSNDINNAGNAFIYGVRTTDRVGSEGYASSDYADDFGGTSAACPAAAGAAALVLSTNPALTRTEVTNILIDTADDMGSSGFDNTFGHGRVNAYQAVLAATGGSGSNCAATITSFPYSEGFESGLGWSQASGDDGNWIRFSGNTPSSSTGPNQAASGNFYLYLEASNNGTAGQIGANATAILESPCIDLSSVSTAFFNFKYHMLGSNMGSLAVDISIDGGSWNTLWNLSGNQGNLWESAQINLGAYLGNTVKIRFVGTTGNGWRSDIAIDDIAISNTATGVVNNCSTTIANFPYAAGFESGNDWSQFSTDDGDWIRFSGSTPSGSTGPNGAGEGNFFLYIEASNNGTAGEIGANATAILESPCMDLSTIGSAFFSFQYHMFGQNMGSLTVDISTDGSTWSPLWDESGNQGNSWETAQIDLASYLGSVVKLRFIGTTGSSWRSDIAIDAVTITTALSQANITAIERTSLGPVADKSNLEKGLVYPNPAKDLLRLKNITGAYDLQIYSKEGTLIQALPEFGDAIDVSLLKPGLYILKATTKNGIVMEKFIKE